MAVNHYENFPVASVLLPRHLRRPVELIYAFARQADDFADEGDWPAAVRLANLAGFDAQLDLIAERFGTTVFVEVKARSFSHQEADALAAVNQRRIARAAALWLTRHPARANAPLRFDVIFLAPFAWPRHIVNAFDASGLLR